MKGGITLGIYVAIGIVGAAFGQSPTPVKTTGVPSVKIIDMTAPVDLNLLATQSTSITHEIGRRSYPSSDGYIPPDRRLEVALTTPETIVIDKTMGGGGSIPEHEIRYRTISRTGAKVEMRGPCWSACTLVTAYIPKERLCFAPGSFLAFHAAISDRKTRAYAEHATMLMYMSYPADIKNWIDRTGGWEHLTPNEYWYLRDQDLWAMGYAKCKLL